MFIEGIPLCLMSYKLNKLLIAAFKHNNIVLVVFILMATCFGISDYHLAILKELNFSKMMVGNTETCRHQNKDN